MKIQSVSAFLLTISIGLGSTALGGCAVEAGPENAGETADDEANLTSAQSKVIKDLRSAVQGLTTGGGEGDADPFKVTTVALKAGEKLNAKFLTTRVLPKLKDVYQSDNTDPDYKPAYRKGTEAEIFDVFSEESSSTKIKNLEKLVRKNLKNVQGGEIGYAFMDSMDTGAVARCIIGQIGNTVVVIWGIDVWT